MKKILAITILTLILLPSCKLADGAANIFKDVKNSYNNIIDEKDKLVEGFTDKKEKLEETVEDIQNATQKIQDALDAVKEVSE